VISTALPTGVPWVNQTGIVVPPADVGALRQAIDRVVGDPALAARLGADGEVRARAEFAVRTMADRLVTVCRQVANGSA
jgi:rhamnosyl/mannosyltransferase